MLFLIGAFLLCFSRPISAIDTENTRLVSDPAVSSEHIAFAYANDVWIANRDGSNVRRLTSHPGVEFGPHFSPDGAWVAFTGRYEGNTDVYVVPTGGGVPKRLTWHPGGDVALGFTPDGKSILELIPCSCGQGKRRALSRHSGRAPGALVTGTRPRHWAQGSQ